VWGFGLDSSGSGYGPVTAVKNSNEPLVLRKDRISWLAEQILAPQEGLHKVSHFLCVKVQVNGNVWNE
jgi:hypothetical protein